MPATLGRVVVKDCDRKEISPIENAIIAMSDKNRELMNLINEKQENPHISVNPLSMVLSGVIDAAVMGGTDKYREAFFKPTYVEENPDNAHFVDSLRKLIGKTVTICEGGLMVHKMHCPASLQEKQKLLETQLETMKKKADADRATGVTSSPTRPSVGSAKAPASTEPLNPFSSNLTDEGGEDAPPPPPRPPKIAQKSDETSDANPFDEAPPVLPPRRSTAGKATFSGANMARRLSASIINPPNFANPFPTEVEVEEDTEKGANTTIEQSSQLNPFSAEVEFRGDSPAQKPKGAPSVRKPNPFAKKKPPTPAPAPAPKAAAKVEPKLLHFPTKDFDSSSDDDDSDDDGEPNPFAAALAVSAKPAPKPVPPRPTSSKPPPVAKKPAP